MSLPDTKEQGTALDTKSEPSQKLHTEENSPKTSFWDRFVGRLKEGDAYQPSLPNKGEAKDADGAD
jgi:hypothetical protein